MACIERGERVACIERGERKRSCYENNVAGVAWRGVDVLVCYDHAWRGVAWRAWRGVAWCGVDVLVCYDHAWRGANVHTCGGAGQTDRQTDNILFTLRAGYLVP